MKTIRVSFLYQLLGQQLLHVQHQFLTEFSVQFLSKIWQQIPTFYQPLKRFKNVYLNVIPFAIIHHILRGFQAQILTKIGKKFDNSAVKILSKMKLELLITLRIQNNLLISITHYEIPSVFINISFYHVKTFRVPNYLHIPLKYPISYQILQFTLLSFSTL